MRSALRVARSLAAVVASLAVVAATTGWLYVARPHVSLPGPRVRDALALDELSHRASVPLLLYLLVWGTAALLLGALARWARTERLTAGLLLALGVGAWTYALDGLSILVVRQIPAHQAFHAAAAEQAVAIPAALAGIAGALLGRTSRSTRPRSPLVLSWYLVAVGALAILDAILPSHRRSLVAALDPAHVHGLSKALVTPLGFALIVAARGLVRGQQRAWQVALALVLALFVLHVQLRFDDGALVTGIAGVALLARRADFRRPGDPSRKPHVLRHAILVALAIVAYGIATLWVNRLMADRPYSFVFALKETGAALVGLSLRHSQHLSGPVGDWFPISAFLLGLGGAGLLLVEWLAPWRYRVRQEARERELVHRLVREHGADTLAPFVLRADKSYFFSTDERAFLAYRVVGGVAIVSGDPIGAESEHAELVGRFLEFAHDRGWRVAVLGASEPGLGLYRGHGLHALYHGDEAVVDTRAFSLDGRPIRKVRQSASRLERAGYTTSVRRPSDIAAAERDALEAIAREWRGTNPERGFAMALDALFGLGDDEALFVVGYDGEGLPRGFLHFAITPAGSALSLSSMPRLRDTPNGFNEWLICESIVWAREHGFERVSLNFSPFAALLAPEAELSRGQKVQAVALRSLKGRFQLDNLLLFNKKFFPTWQRRFVVYERRRDLPRVGVAALAAEAYLPFQKRAA